MFENLSERLNRTLKNISGQGRITEDNIKDTLREVRTALLEADVALSVVKDFTSKVKEQALGTIVSTSLTPGQEFIRIVHDQLVETMGAQNAALNVAHQPPAVILLAGLQGAGKTTSAAKLGLYIKERLKKSVLMCSVDTYRPAAIEQLHTLGRETGIPTFPSDPKSTPLEIARAALDDAQKHFTDVLIIDTAGRLAVDEAMMQEVKQLHELLDPTETMFVVDAMTGQDAANTAKAFADALPLTGVILTKADGDARGGAALSVRQITGQPIKFIGMGEKIEVLEPFHPDRIASRILGMGDVLSLVEELQRKTDTQKAEKFAQKIKKGEAFTFHVEAIILAMTPKERRNPEIIKATRKKRIAAGAGVTVTEINQMLNQFGMMQKMMKKVGKKGGMRGMMNAMRAIPAMRGMMNGAGMGGMMRK